MIITTPPRQAARRSRVSAADILLKIAAYPLIIGVGGGVGLWLLHRPQFAVLIAAPCLGLAAVLILAAAFTAVRGHRRNPWPALAAVIAVAAAVAWQALPRASQPAVRPVVAALAAVAIGGCFRAGIRSRRRRRAGARYNAVIAPLLPAGTPSPVTRVRAWDGCAVREVVLTGPPGFDVTHPDFQAKVRRAVTAGTPAKHVSLSADPLTDQLTVTVTEPDAEDPADIRTRAIERAKAAAGNVLPDASIANAVIDEEQVADGADAAGAGHALASFTLKYGQTPKVTLPSSREQIIAHLSMQLYGDPDMLRARWEVDMDRVHLAMRRQFPDIIAHIAQDVAAFSRGRTVLPYGDDEDGNTAIYPLSRTALPHGLIIGPTGGGKTQLLLVLAIEAARQGIEVHGCDPKRIELMGLRGWPNVTKIATRVTDMIKLIEDDYDEMHRRYELIETGQARESDFRRILLILDEYFIFGMLVANWWAANRQKDDPKEHPVIRKIGELAALARSGKINLVIGCQRPDAVFFYDGARDNFGWRVSLGRLSQQGAQMLWGDAKTGTDVPADVPGLCTATTPAGPRRTKVHWVPNPAGALTGELTDDDMAQLRSLLPPGTTWDGPLTATAPDPGFEDTAAAADAAAADPATGFLYLIRTALRTRTAHLTAWPGGGAPAVGQDAALYGWSAANLGGRPEPSGTWIGCVEETKAGRRIYLRPEEALQVARSFAAELQIPYDHDRAALDKALHRSGLLQIEKPEGGEVRYTIRKPLPGSDKERDRVWSLPEDAVLGDAAPPTVPAWSQPEASPAPELVSSPEAEAVIAAELGKDTRILIEDPAGQVVAVTVYNTEPNPGQAGHILIHYYTDQAEVGIASVPATDLVPLAKT